MEAFADKKLDLRVAVRTGDTTPAVKQKMLKTPPHILITTPESFAIMLRDGGLNLCTQKTGAELGENESYVEFGNYGLTETGTTTFFDAMADFVSETGAVVELFGSRDGKHLSSLFYANGMSAAAMASINDVLTCKWFRLRVSGRYNLKALEISGQRGGNR